MRAIINTFLLIITITIAAPAAEIPRVVQRFNLSYRDTLGLPMTLLPRYIPERPRLGLALSGGGMRGVAQIGVLRALDDHDINIDYIVGTSIGAVVGALYSSGYTPEEIYTMARDISWTEILNDEPDRSSLFLGEKQKRSRSILELQMDNLKPILPEAFTPGQRVGKLFTDILLNAPYQSNQFESLPIPLRIIATDLNSGRKILFTEGDLTTVLRATVAIPLLFSPVEIDSFSLVDGGIVRNIPVAETFETGVEHVIAVDASSPIRRRDQIQFAWEVADQVTTIMQQSTDDEQLAMADLVIGFDDVQVTNTDFSVLDSLYNLGYQRTLDRMDQIKAVTTSMVEPTKTVKLDSILIDERYRRLLQHGDRACANLINHSLHTIARHGRVQKAFATLEATSTDTLLIYHIEEYPKLADIEFVGNEAIADSLLRPCFAPILQHPMHFDSVTTALKSALKMYRRQGYSLARFVEARYSPLTQTAQLYINEGVLSDIKFEGNEKTRQWVIDREFKIRPGERFHLRSVQDNIDNIYATNLFSNVSLGIQQNREQNRMTVRMQEKRSDVLRLGMRYDRQRYAKLFFEYADENIAGSGNDLSFYSLFGDRDLRLHADYRADRIFKSLMTAQANMHYSESEHYAFENMEQVGEYNRRTSGLLVNVGRQIERFGTLSFTLRLEEITLDSLGGRGYDTGTMNINTFGIKSVIDTRDRTPFPNEGKHHIFFYEVSSGWIFGADQTYYKVMNQLSTFNTFFEHHTFCPKLIWGTSDVGTPYSEQFRLGADRNFFGLNEGQMWGKHMAQVSFEYRYKLPAWWRFDTFFSLRYDLGGAWQRLEELKPDDFISGYGVQLAIDTPIGPFTTAYGLTNRGQQRLYFSAGYSF